MQSTAPMDWFLTADEIAEARGGRVPLRSLEVMTSGNTVEPLVDGMQFMQRLRQDVSRATKGDFVHLTGWYLDTEIQMVPPETSSTVLNVLSDRIHAGVTSRFLVWRPSVLPFARIWCVNRLTKRTLDVPLGQTGNAGGCVLDDNLPRFGSHHQKTAIVSNGGVAVGYCGGMDLSRDRWDTMTHDMPNRPFTELTGRAGKFFRTFPGWHDVQVRVEGPAVLDLERNFRDRWNDPNNAKNGARVIRDPLPRAGDARGTHHVQVLRTYACKGHNFPGFAPNGELTGLRGYLKAIARAQTYIYLEEQFLWSEEIAQAIAQVLPRIQALVILLPPKQELGRTGYSLQRRFLDVVRAVAPDKVLLFHLSPPRLDTDVYVHSKVMIIDDVYAVVGSINIGRRSMTCDSEVSLAVIDRAVENGVCKFARDLRRLLWKEHLGVDVADPSTGIETWRRQAASNGAYKVRHHPPPRNLRVLGAATAFLLDKDGRCPR